MYIEKRLDRDVLCGATILGGMSTLNEIFPPASDKGQAYLWRRLLKRGPQVDGNWHHLRDLYDRSS